VGIRPNPKKTPIPNSPKKILFVKQRENLKFLQNIKVQLVTLISVYLRMLPFSDRPPKSPINQKIPKPQPNDPNLSSFHSPIIKGRPADLILYVTRFNITHILIYFFIQKSFSHKFLKPLLNVQSILSYELSNIVLYILINP
jgi:hypothetical protein